jgi:hypothetical protein
MAIVQELIDLLQSLTEEEKLMPVSLQTSEGLSQNIQLLITQEYVPLADEDYDYSEQEVIIRCARKKDKGLSIYRE